MKKIIQNIVTSLVFLLLTSTGGVAKDRVFIKDVAGIWINQSYVEELRKNKMPHLAAEIAPPLIIAIRRAGNSYPFVVTNLDEAALQVVIDVEPDKKPGSYRLVLAPDNKPIGSDEVKFLWFRGIRNLEGEFKKLEMAEIFLKKGKWDTYINVGDKIGPFINKAVIAGLYIDQENKRWEFSPEGQAYLPNETFYYELSLRAKDGECEFIEGEDLKAEDGLKRIGFVWINGALNLFKAELQGNKVKCESTPYEVLKPVN